VKERGCVLILESHPQLLFAQDKCLDDHDDANPDQDEGTNDHSRYAGRPYDLYDDSDTAEESQAEDSLPGFTAEDQRFTTREA